MIKEPKQETLNRPSIVRYLAHYRTKKAISEVDEIFFESSGTKKFGSEEEKSAFRARWLGRYLDHHPGQAYLAVADKGQVGQKIVGYLVGSLDDPALSPMFSDLGYFEKLKNLTPFYPAQLHVNIASAWRGVGLGRDLVCAFLEDLRHSSVPGVHVITSEGMRNINFYLGCGFEEVGSCIWNDRKLLMLGLRFKD